MKKPIVITMLIVSFISCVGLEGQQVLLSYELYSWQDAHGNWEFSLLYTTSMRKTAKVIFDRRATLHGVKRLEERIKSVRSGTEIVWIENVPGGDKPKAKGTERLKLPPDEIIREIQKYAESLNVKVSIYGHQ